MTDFVECAPMYDMDERLALWYFNLRLVFLGRPEARISVLADGMTQIRRDGDERALIERQFGRDIDQNNWIGRLQAETLLADYLALQ
jgi:hypothetical protein